MFQRAKQTSAGDGRPTWDTFTPEWEKVRARPSQWRRGGAFLSVALLCFLFAVSCGGADGEGGRNGDSPEDETFENAQPSDGDAEKDEAVKKIHYVSVGDSIARGFGLEDVANTRYSALIRARFAEEGWSCTEENRGVDGQTSTELISYLDTVDLSSADVVTISIGANNVLGPAVDFLYAYYAYRTYAVGPGGTYTEEEIARASAQAYRQFTERAEEGVETLEADIPAILSAIRAQNETCVVVFLTIYNPYAAVDDVMMINGLPIDFAALSGGYTSRLSSVIEAGAKENGYVVADVRGAFDGKEARLVAAGASDGMGNRDPHPNALGHRVIADTVYDAIRAAMA